MTILENEARYPQTCLLTVFPGSLGIPTNRWSRKLALRPRPSTVYGSCREKWADWLNWPAARRETGHTVEWLKQVILQFNNKPAFNTFSTVEWIVLNCVMTIYQKHKSHTDTFVFSAITESLPDVWKFASLLSWPSQVHLLPRSVLWHLLKHLGNKLRPTFCLLNHWQTLICRQTDKLWDIGSI